MAASAAAKAAAPIPEPASTQYNNSKGRAAGGKGGEGDAVRQENDVQGYKLHA